MRVSRVRRLALSRFKERWERRPGIRGILLRDYAQERLGLSPGEAMFEGMEVGMIVVLDTFSFPYVGEVVRINDQGITLKNAVKVLYDGRHGEFSKGAKKVPATAEIEATYPLYTVATDFIGGWGIYPGGKIPDAQ